jgi:hypothetical protein
MEFASDEEDEHEDDGKAGDSYLWKETDGIYKERLLIIVLIDIKHIPMRTPSRPGASGIDLLSCVRATRTANAQARCLIVLIRSVCIQEIRTFPMVRWVSIQLRMKINMVNNLASPCLLIFKSRSRLGALVPSGRVT